MIGPRTARQAARIGTLAALLFGGLVVASPVASAQAPEPVRPGTVVAGDGAPGGIVKIEVLCIKSTCGDLASNNGNGAPGGDATLTDGPGTVVAGDGARGGTVTAKALCLDSTCGDVGSGNGNGAPAGEAKAGEGTAVAGDAAPGGTVTIDAQCIKSRCGDVASNNGNGEPGGDGKVVFEG